MRRRSASASRGTSSPSTEISPAVGVNSPQSMRIVVDLPEPFGPRKPYTCAAGTVRSTWSTATRVLNRLVNPRARIAVSSGGIEFDPRRQARGQVGGLLVEGYLREITEASRILAGQGVVGREYRLAADHAHATRHSVFTSRD